LKFLKRTYLEPQLHDWPAWQPEHWQFAPQLQSAMVVVFDGGDYENFGRLMQDMALKNCFD
jgi:hypothetical protein